ncbi:MAG: hypothetical protein V4537_14260 [Pseudomonadota bacterium]
MKLGKLPPRLDPRTLRMARYMTPELPPPPAAVDWTRGMGDDFGMMLNDRIGCCTCSTPGHMVQVFSAANGARIDIPDAAILKAYKDVSGYDGTDESDRGAVVLDVLRYWKNVGIGGHKILGFAAVDLKNRIHTMQAIHVFGGIYLGASLPESIDRQETWRVDLGDAGDGRASLGGHAFSAHSYDEHGPRGITWARRQPTTWPFLDAYSDEAFVVVSEEWADANGAPSGFDRDQLLADIRAVS